MNKDLQKDIITPDKMQEKRRGYNKKHMEKCKTLCVTLRNKEDADILAWLSSFDNKSDAVRHALRREATKPVVKVLLDGNEVGNG